MTASRSITGLVLAGLAALLAGCASTASAARATPAVASAAAGTAAAGGRAALQPQATTRAASGLTLPIPAGDAEVLASLRQRPLNLPRLRAGQPCPRARGSVVHPAFGAAIGDGPVYAGLGVDGRLPFALPIPPNSGFYGSAWSGQKVLWIVAATYRGPVLIRGRQVDGPEELRFNDGMNPPAELPLPAVSAETRTTDGWRDVPSYTRLRAPGCYAYQVDGQGFREVIIFQAVVAQ